MKKSIKFTIENKYNKKNGKRTLVLGDQYLRSVEVSFKGYEDWENILDDFSIYANKENENLNVEISGNPFQFQDESGDTLYFETGLFENDKEAIQEIKRIWKEFKNTLSKNKVEKKVNTVSTVQTENKLNKLNQAYNIIMGNKEIENLARVYTFVNREPSEFDKEICGIKENEKLFGYHCEEYLLIMINVQGHRSVSDLIDTIAHEIAHIVYSGHGKYHTKRTKEIRKFLKEYYINIQKSIALYKKVLYNINSEGGKYKMRFTVKRFSDFDIRVRKHIKLKQYYTRLNEMIEEDDIF